MIVNDLRQRSNNPLEPSRHERPRRASILVCVLVCMAVATALVLTTTRAALRARRDARTQRQLRQTELLLEAGVQRAALRLRTDADYAGETWSLSADTLAGFGAAQVEITVSKLNGNETRQVDVVARLPAQSPTMVQRSYTFPFHPASLNEE